MQTDKKWLVMLPLNKIEYNIQLKDGTARKGLLRFTLYQQRRHEDLMKEIDSKTIYDLAELVLNPEPDKVDFTRAELEEALDIDEAKLLYNLWMEKKVIAPHLSKQTDPSFF